MRSAALFIVGVMLCSGCSGNEGIIEAAERGDIERVKVLVEGDASQMFMDDGKGNTPAVLAILDGHKEVAIYLVEKGYPMNGTPAYPFPLLLACCSRYDKSSEEMLEYLLKAGADPNVVYEKEGWWALDMAVNNDMPEKVKLLVKYGARMDQVDKRGATVMELARNRLAMFKDPAFNLPHGEFQDPAVRKKSVDRWRGMVGLLESLQGKP